MSAVTRFIGGSPGRVAFQLIVMSIVVGIILNLLGVSPYDIVNGLQRLAMRIYNMGFGTVEWIFRYFLLGAVVVVPIWLIMRLLKAGRNEGGNHSRDGQAG
ncbi:MAG: integrase [Bauldia sp.]|nr:integrase [Bauldia sp.]